MHTSGLASIHAWLINATAYRKRESQQTEQFRKSCIRTFLLELIFIAHNLTNNRKYPLYEHNKLA